MKDSKFYIKDIVDTQEVFNQNVKGVKKNEMFVYKVDGDDYIVLNESRDENINIFFVSRLYNYIGAHTFKSLLAKNSDEKLLLLMENIFDNTNNVQISNKKIQLDLIIALYFNETIIKDFFAGNTFINLLGNDDKNPANIFFNKNCISLIDLKSIADYRFFRNDDINFKISDLFLEEQNEYFSASIISIIDDTIRNLYAIREKVDPVKLEIWNVSPFYNEKFLKENIKLKKEDFESFDINELIKLTNNNFKINESVKASNYDKEMVFIKDSMLLILKEYGQKHGFDKKGKDFLQYFSDGTFEKERSLDILDSIRESTIITIRNLLLLNEKDIDIIFLRNEKNDLLKFITEDELNYEINLLYNKQNELFYYISRYKLLHKVLNRPKNEENDLQILFKVNTINYVTTELKEFVGFEYLLETQEFKKSLEEKRIKFSNYLRNEVKNKNITIEDLFSCNRDVLLTENINNMVTVKEADNNYHKNSSDKFLFNEYLIIFIFFIVIVYIFYKKIITVNKK